MKSAAQHLGAETPNPPRGGFFVGSACLYPLVGRAEAERAAYFLARSSHFGIGRNLASA